MNRMLVNHRTFVGVARKTRVRRGTTLIETLIVVTLVSAVLGTVAVLLQGVWRAERAVRDHRASMASVFRVAELFRNDVHAGTLAEAPPPAGTSLIHRLVLSLPEGRTVEYQSDGPNIVRVVQAGGAITHRDTFPLTAHSTAGWQLSADDPRHIALLISQPLGSQQLPLSDKRTLRIDAAVGLPSEVLAPGAQ